MFRNKRSLSLPLTPIYKACKVSLSLFLCGRSLCGHARCLRTLGACSKRPNHSNSAPPAPVFINSHQPSSTHLPGQPSNTPRTAPLRSVTSSSGSGAAATVSSSSSSAMAESNVKTPAVVTRERHLEPRPQKRAAEGARPEMPGKLVLM